MTSGDFSCITEWGSNRGNTGPWVCRVVPSFRWHREHSGIIHTRVRFKAEATVLRTSRKENLGKGAPFPGTDRPIVSLLWVRRRGLQDRASLPVQSPLPSRTLVFLSFCIRVGLLFKQCQTYLRRQPEILMAKPQSDSGEFLLGPCGGRQEATGGRLGGALESLVQGGLPGAMRLLGSLDGAGL